MKDSVLVFSDHDALSSKAASIFIDLSKRAASKGNAFSFVISGGSTPLPLFSLLATGPYRDEVDWRLVHFFWADERCVPPGDEESNFGTAYRSMLSMLPVPASNIHRIKGEQRPDEAARGYEDEIRAYFKYTGKEAFDLVMLGLGSDGHTASLFPGSDALRERTRLAAAVYAEGLKSWRVSLTLPAINGAGRVVFLVTGTSKAAILRDLLDNEPARRSYPAGLVAPAGGALTWLVDQGAASILRKRPA